MRTSFRPSCWLALAILSGAAFAQTPSAPIAAWSGKDAQGHDVKIPAKGKATVLAFLRPGQSQTEEVMKIVGAFKDRADVQIIAVVSGDDAPALALALVRGKWPAPIVIDTDYALSGRLGVNVWPTTIAVGSEAAGGAIQGHLAGLPATFSNDLAAHVDFAAGKIDRAALDKALSNREVVAESGEQRAARHVEVALRLAAKGMTDGARAELARAVELKPTEGPVLLAIARVNLIVNNPQPALTILGQIKEGGGGGGATASEINVLKGWAAVEMEQWAEARKVLTDAARLNPDPAEAFYLLGRVCEHDGQTAQAAEYYRKAFEKSETGKQMGASATGEK